MSQDYIKFLYQSYDPPKCRGIYNDPTDPMGLGEPDNYDNVDYFFYPEFFFWRELHEVSQEDKTEPSTYRCPRCFSANVNIGYPYIQCLSCGYNEPLIDFPISRYSHLALAQNGKAKIEELNGCDNIR